MSGHGQGRGSYYKQKYGRGGKKNDHYGATRQSSGNHDQQSKRKRTGLLGDANDLAAWLRNHENRPYPAYHDIEGCWSFDSFEFFLDHAQADPYAAPSKAHIRIPHTTARYPESLYRSSIRKIALADYLLRVLYTNCTEKKYNQRLASSGWSGGKGGQLEVDRPGQQVLERSAVVVGDDAIEIRLVVGLPARGRSIMGEYATDILCQHIPSLVESVYHCNLDPDQLVSHVLTIEDQDALRSMLPKHGLVGFVCEGAVLARKSGASDGPMLSPPAVPFQSPESLKVQLNLPNRGKISGMGIRKQCVYVCLGGGFHGKSTFLAALSSGSYNHIAGDGREFVSVVDSAVSVRSEDGRAVHSVDISPFINNLPDKSDTRYAANN
ncbi:hypothetical protein MYAM1_001818 [Malassezia yamatoensis]|uniref:Uncharacterized protein n=1 Tax=Malassezia yamatoensis TaxID=253288 RepID=A0AAJ5YUS0_9BASI|nr:hypothetical protein MYAM1_001818 [Malassezia yamatoensis]